MSEEGFKEAWIGWRGETRGEELWSAECDQQILEYQWAYMSSICFKREVYHYYSGSIHGVSAASDV